MMSKTGFMQGRLFPIKCRGIQVVFDSGYTGSTLVVDGGQTVGRF